MSITIPSLRRDKRAPRHKAADEVARLRHQLQGAGFLIAGLRQQVTDARAAEDRANAKATRLDEAEAYAKAVEQELNELRAFKANATAISAPAGQRDIDPDDQPTHPQGIDVSELRDRFTSGPVVSLHHSPQADPGQTTWGTRNEQGVA